MKPTNSSSALNEQMDLYQTVLQWKIKAGETLYIASAQLAITSFAFIDFSINIKPTDLAPITVGRADNISAFQ